MNNKDHLKAIFEQKSLLAKQMVQKEFWNRTYKKLSCSDGVAFPKDNPVLLIHQEKIGHHQTWKVLAIIHYKNGEITDHIGNFMKKSEDPRFDIQSALSKHKNVDATKIMLLEYTIAQNPIFEWIFWKPFESCLFEESEGKFKKHILIQEMNNKMLQTAENSCDFFENIGIFYPCCISMRFYMGSSAHERMKILKQLHHKL